MFANPPDLATIPAGRLKDALAVLGEEDQDRVMRAFDEVVSRA